MTVASVSWKWAEHIYFVYRYVPLGGKSNIRAKSWNFGYRAAYRPGLGASGAGEEYKPGAGGYPAPDPLWAESAACAKSWLPISIFEMFIILLGYLKWCPKPKCRCFSDKTQLSWLHSVKLETHSFILVPIPSADSHSAPRTVQTKINKKSENVCISANFHVNVWFFSYKQRQKEEMLWFTWFM